MQGEPRHQPARAPHADMATAHARLRGLATAIEVGARTPQQTPNHVLIVQGEAYVYDVGWEPADIGTQPKAWRRCKPSTIEDLPTLLESIAPNNIGHEFSCAAGEPTIDGVPQF